MILGNLIGLTYSRTQVQYTQPSHCLLSLVFFLPFHDQISLPSVLMTYYSTDSIVQQLSHFRHYDVCLGLSNRSHRQEVGDRKQKKHRMTRISHDNDVHTNNLHMSIPFTLFPTHIYLHSHLLTHLLTHPPPSFSRVGSLFEGTKARTTGGSDGVVRQCWVTGPSGSTGDLRIPRYVSYIATTHTLMSLTTRQPHKFYSCY